MFMAEITLKGEPFKLQGSLLKEGDLAPDFVLVNSKLENITLDSFKDRKKLLITVPSLDTNTCAQESRILEEYAKKHPEFYFILVSRDLPFAQDRFCLSEKIDNIQTLSFMRLNSTMFNDYGISITDGPLAGLCARVLFVLNENDRIVYTQLVEEISNEPNYEEAFTALES
jgi:thioredoxin-dependent peroxiredoxin